MVELYLFCRISPSTHSRRLQSTTSSSLTTSHVGGHGSTHETKWELTGHMASVTIRTCGQTKSQQNKLPVKCVFSKCKARMTASTVYVLTWNNYNHQKSFHDWMHIYWAKKFVAPQKIVTSSKRSILTQAAQLPPVANRSSAFGASSSVRGQIAEKPVLRSRANARVSVARLKYEKK